VDLISSVMDGHDGCSKECVDIRLWLVVAVANVVNCCLRRLFSAAKRATQRRV